LIAFGIVHIPVNLPPPLKPRASARTCCTRRIIPEIRYQRISEATGRKLSAEEIVHGYEVERDNFVVI
jgi:non-homologous end joining protein Ku